MSTAYRLDYWSITYTNDEGNEHTKWFPLDLSLYGGQAWLYRLEPPTLDGHEHILIRDCGYLLALNSIDGEPEGMDVPTRIENVVEVFAARPDGSVESMTAIRTPLSLRRPADGADVTAILTGLGYDESDQRQYLTADGTLTTGTAAQIAAWEAEKETS